MNASVLRAVFFRNFLSYFSGATGYAFICVFVCASSFAAFWTEAFFNKNLANLDQLNAWFPWIMLIFVPAITMGMWAQERRQGTDELLLTMPAADFDIVLGKYLAAVAIYTVSLLFSLVTNYLVLNQLAGTDPGLALKPAIDVGLILGTYLGYWLVGLAMLAVGMVASFLTDNLTVAFIFGAAFNLPLVILSELASFLPDQSASSVLQWSFGGQLAEFGRGVVSLEGVLYFAAIVVVMLYLSMALIGRRHWARRGGGMMGVHYLLRTLALLIIVCGLVYFARPVRARVDVSSEKLSQLSKPTRDLLAGLKTDRPIEIEAFISPEASVPKDFVTTRKNLLDVLDEIRAVGGKHVQVIVHSTEPFTPEATRAEDNYRILPRDVHGKDGGALTVKPVYMGVTIRSGLQRETIPFIDRGTPVEYELIRSIRTALEEVKPKIGVLKTGAPLLGQPNFMTGQSSPDWRLIKELREQYEIVEIDPSGPIDLSSCAALLAVQPSMLNPEQMPHFIDAVRRGMPTLILEDPLSIFGEGVVPTSLPRPPAGGMMGMQMGRQSEPKGDIEPLWKTLGIQFAQSEKPGDTILWQNYNAYPEDQRFDKIKEFIFIDRGCGAKEPFSPTDPISSGMQQLFFAFAGSITKLNASTLEVTPLAQTGDQTGVVKLDDILQIDGDGRIVGSNPYPRRQDTGETYATAVHVTGELPPLKDDAADAPDANKEDASKENTDKKDAAKKGDAKKESKKAAPVKINVVVIADVDAITDELFKIREEGQILDRTFFAFDNVPFVLNALDSLAGIDTFLEIRKRRPRHCPLARIEEESKEAKRERDKVVKQLEDEFEKMKRDEQRRIDEQQARFAEKCRKEISDEREAQRRASQMAMAVMQRLNANIARLEKKNRLEQARIETALRQQENAIRNRYKLLAVLLPPIPPLVLAIVFFVMRRLREREGVAQSRLR